MHAISSAGTFIPAVVLTLLVATGCDHENVTGAAGEDGTASECVGACDPLCVDAGRYLVAGDVVEDTSDGRLWQRPVDARLTWDDAVDYCATLTLDGLHGFRLPSPDELDGIRYDPGGLFADPSAHHYCIPSIDQAAFPNTPSDEFWTSSRMPDDTAWYVDFMDGRSHRDTYTDSLWVRCTHDPVPAPPE
jgi:hypothetical protein